RDSELVRLTQRLHEEPVDAAGDERVGLLEERFSNHREIVGERLTEKVSRRPDRADDERLRSGSVSRDLDRGEVELLHLSGEAMLLETHGVRAECVRLEDLSPGPHVVIMDFADDFWLRDAQLLETRVVEDASLVKLRAHRAVNHERPAR